MKKYSKKVVDSLRCWPLHWFRVNLEIKSLSYPEGNIQNLKNICPNLNNSKSLEIIPVHSFTSSILYFGEFLASI